MRFLPQKSCGFAANNALCYILIIPHKADAHVGDVRGTLLPRRSRGGFIFILKLALPDNFAKRNCQGEVAAAEALSARTAAGVGSFFLRPLGARKVPRRLENAVCDQKDCGICVITEARRQ